MTIKMSNIIWHEADLMLPAKDGEYPYMSKYNDIGTVLYTPEGGWNTFRDTDGSVKGAGFAKDDYVKLWADPIKVSEVRLNDSAE